MLQPFAGLKFASGLLNRLGFGRNKHLKPMKLREFDLECIKDVPSLNITIAISGYLS